MIRKNNMGDKPRVDDTAFIHPSARVIGNVLVGAKVFVGPNAVIRADGPDSEGEAAAIVIESEANIQDGVTIHAPGGSLIRIGKGAVLAHGAVVRGPCHVGGNCFIGFDSALFEANLGKGTVVQHEAFVEGVTIETGMHVPSKAVVLNEEDVQELRPAATELAAFAESVRRASVFLVKVA